MRVRPAPSIPVTVTASPSGPVAGQPVTFTVEVSPPAGAPEVREVTVDFGDDSTTSLGALTGRRSLVHVYDAAGSYVVTATVRDAAGRRHRSSIAVVVRVLPAILVTVTPPTADPEVDQRVTFTVNVSPPPEAPAVRSVTIDFGDGSASRALGAWTGRRFEDHIYATAGRYTVTATVRDAAGRVHAASTVVNVRAEARGAPMREVLRRALRAAAGRAAVALSAVALAASAGARLDAAGEISITLDRGRVTLVATGARLADVLAEWSRVGDTRFEGAEALGGEPITLRLVDAPEADALHLLFRAAVGYVAAPRPPGAAGASRYDRITVLAVRGTALPPVPEGGRARGGAAASAAEGADDPTRSPAEAPVPVRMEELQRLLDAAAAAPAATAGRGDASGRAGGGHAVPGDRRRSGLAAPA